MIWITKEYRFSVCAMFAHCACPRILARRTQWKRGLNCDVHCWDIESLVHWSSVHGLAACHLAISLIGKQVYRTPPGVINCFFFDQWTCTLAWACTFHSSARADRIRHIQLMCDRPQLVACNDNICLRQWRGFDLAKLDSCFFLHSAAALRPHETPRCCIPMALLRLQVLRSKNVAGPVFHEGFAASSAAKP